MMMNKSNTKLLVILPFIPYPLTDGGKIGVFHMLNALKEAFDVHVWFHINNEKKTLPLIKELDAALGGKVKLHYSANKIGRNFVTARALKKKFDAWFLKKDAQYLHNGLWGSGVSGFCDVQALNDINKIIQDNDIKLVQVEFPLIIDMVYALPKNVKTVFVHHELIFTRRRRVLERMKIIAYDAYRYRKGFDEEISALNRYDCVITLSDVDKQKLLENGVTSRIESSPLFIPRENDSYPTFRPTKNRLTYIASARHAPNIDGLLWFLRNVHPYLVKHVDYQLDIIGKGWKETLKNIDLPKNVNCVGFVENLADFVPGSVMIVPILYGSGMRMKILEANNNSVPFVTTTIGVEGLEFTDGESCFVADDGEKFANCIIELFKNEELQHTMVEKAREVYDKKYLPAVLSKLRIDILNSMIDA